MSHCQSVPFTANPKSHKGFRGEPSETWRGLPARKPDGIDTGKHYRTRKNVSVVQTQKRQKHVGASGLKALATSMHDANGNMLLLPHGPAGESPLDKEVEDHKQVNGSWSAHTLETHLDREVEPAKE